MGASQAVLARLWLYAFLLGVGLGAVYDALRITRVFLGVSYTDKLKERLHNVQLPYLAPRPPRRTSRVLGAVMFFEDFFFAAGAGIAMILLFYQVNSGKIRIPAFFCAAIGFCLYCKTLGKLVMYLSEAIAFWIEVALRYVFFFITLPIRWGLKRILKLLRLLGGKYRARADERARRRATARAWRALEENAGGMIPPIKKRKQ